MKTSHIVLVGISGLLTACGGEAGPARSLPAVAGARSDGFALPVVVEHDRWFLQTTTADGAALRMYLDSAGGMYMLRSAAERLKLPIKRTKSDDGEMYAAPFPALADPHVPRPKLDPFPVWGEALFDDVDGMLGAPWFAGHTFTFDYPNHRLVLRTQGDVPNVAPEHLLVMGLVRDPKGEPTSPFCRMQMVVDGKPLDMLFDTGATVDLTDAALAALGGTARQRGTSFITQTVFDGWRAAHPTWRVVEAADRSMKDDPAPMIEVPAITVAGHQLGPVWFTRRPDRAFHEWMAQWMDKPTEGALGGSAFKTLRITVDWISGRAVFER